MKLTLVPLNERYAICRLPPDAPSPTWASGEFVSVTATATELSVVAPQTTVPDGVHASMGWRIFVVQGPLPFHVVGVLAAISSCLAAAEIPIFAVSTHDTDYIATRETDFAAALAALAAAGHVIAAAS